MRGYRRLATGLILIISSTLNGCGTYVPDLQEFYDPQTAQIMVDAIVDHVQCEVQSSVQFLLLDDADAAAKAKALHLEQGPSLDWLKQWAAQVTLTLTIDEKGSVNPGVALTPPLAPAVMTYPNKVTVTTAQSFSLGFGATASADATRKETLAWLIDFKRFTAGQALQKAKLERDPLYKAAQAAGVDPVAMLCDRQNGGLIQGDLKLREWLYAVTIPAFVRGGAVPDYAKSLKAEAQASKKDVISHEITFVILYGGNVTPSWKLLRVSVNQGAASLLSAQRTRTQDLLITMGPAPAGTPSQSALNTTLASQIGIAVANAIRNTQ